MAVAAESGANVGGGSGAASTGVLTTADGIPLKTALSRALRRQKIRALLLVAPLFLFIVITFVIPIGQMLWLSVDNSIVPKVLPRTVAELKSWDPDKSELPGEAAYKAVYLDIIEAAKTKSHTRVGNRLNYEHAGMSSLFRSAPRKFKRIKSGPYKAALIKANKKWGKPETWTILKRFSGALTDGYFLSALDRKRTAEGEIKQVDEENRIYLFLFFRTIMLSIFITFMTLLLGYPIAYLLATLPARTSNLLMILVLLPFWTSLLVRTTSWIVLLQQQGVFNDLLVSVGLISDSGRLALMHNSYGTVIAMTQILLPFMILPTYSVMKTISPSYMRAARSLGANPMVAFWRVYFPNTVPGIGAGAILVFILSIGYYITPELVGGTTGTFISNRIAYNVEFSLNWGLAAALGTVLLVLVLLLYFVYDRIVGIDNMKLG